MKNVSTKNLEFVMANRTGTSLPEMYVRGNRTLVMMSLKPKRSGITKAEKELASDIVSLYSIIRDTITLEELRKFCNFKNDVMYKLTMRYKRAYEHGVD